MVKDADHLIDPPPFMIKVPASTANLGPGFDSVGMALSLYLTLEVNKADHWYVEALTPALSIYPNDETHWIVQIACDVAKKYGVKISPAHLRVQSEIPLARGLGSSAAAIVAGVELANQLGNLHLSKREILSASLHWENHPDNLAPAIFGGVIITATGDGQIYYQQGMISDVDIVVFIPDYELKTADARAVLPPCLTYSVAVKASSYGNVLSAALMNGDWEVVGEMMERDLYHHPYRKPLLPHFTAFEGIAKEYDAFGCAISGAGPTTLAFLPQGKGEACCKDMNQALEHGVARVLTMDRQGSQSIIL